MPKIDLGLVKGQKGDKGDQGDVGPQGAQGIQGVPGADATINGYNTTTVTATGNVTLTQSGSAMTLKTTAEVDAVVKWACNRNLLDNWYFANPINQRGRAEYTESGYTIDRWMFDAARNLLSIRDGYVTVTLRRGYFMQRLSLEAINAMRNNTVTLSVLTTKGLGTLTFKAPDTFDDFDSPDISNIDGSGMYADIYMDAGTGTVMRFYSTGTINLVAVKLELGGHQTLAHKEGDAWVLNGVPDYGTELLKCQRYLSPILLGGEDIDLEGIWYGNGVTTNLRLPVPLRARPTVVSTLSGSVRIVGAKELTTASRYEATAYDGGPNINLLTYSENPGFTLGDRVTMDALGSTGGLFFSAEL